MQVIRVELGKEVFMLDAEHKEAVETLLAGYMYRVSNMPPMPNGIKWQTPADVKRILIEVLETCERGVLCPNFDYEVPFAVMPEAVQSLLIWLPFLKTERPENDCFLIYRGTDVSDNFKQLTRDAVSYINEHLSKHLTAGVCYMAPLAQTVAIDMCVCLFPKTAERSDDNETRN